MPQSRMFMSSCSRRQLARRRRSGRTPARVPLLLVALLIAVALAAFMAGHGGI